MFEISPNFLIVMIGLGNGWVSDKHQAIMWTNDDKDPSCIIESVENNV